MLRSLLQRIKNGPKTLLRYDDTTTVTNNARDAVMSSSLDRNRAILRELTQNCGDIIFRELRIGTHPGHPALLIYLEGLTEKTTINQSILTPLMRDTRLLEPNRPIRAREAFDLVVESIVSVGHLDTENEFSQLLMRSFSGDTILMIEGVNRCIVLDTKAWEQRGVEEPQTEAVVRGSREGFTESISVNLSLLRRRIRGAHLKIERMVLGRQTNTPVAIAYVAGIVNPKLLAEVKRRILRIDTDAILESGYIEQLIEDAPLSPFFTIANTERPDVAAAKILEGRVAIFTDGTPFVLTVPTVFFESFQVAEDQYSRPFFVSFIRIIRHVSFFVTFFLPSIYVAVQTFHQELLPTQLAIAMAADREAIPFPAAVEALIMMLIFDVLREAGVRMPRPVGQAVAIVGTLVLGSAGIESRLVSPAMVMVIAVTGITSFVLPPQTGNVGPLKYVALLLSSTVGLYGVMLSFVGIVLHLSTLRSFGTPFLSPLAPVDWNSWRDAFIRAPLWMLDERPDSVYPEDIRKQGTDQKPQAPNSNGEGATS